MHVYLSQDVPTSDPHYVTTFGFFGRHDHGDSKRTSSFMVNLTDALRRLERGKQLRGDDLVVQILPVPRPGVSLEETAPVTPAQIEVAII
jgi:tyrosinase